jgi:hypothetical protein
MGEFEPVLPLRAVVFQVLFLLVAIAIEAAVLRQTLRWGYQKSVQYATIINLLATVIGWLTFLILEPLVGERVKAQLISYVLFDRLINNSLRPQMGWIMLIAGFLAFFLSLLIKLKGLELLMRLLNTWEIPDRPRQLSRNEKYDLARTGRTLYQRAASKFATAVLQANALSFSAILVLLMLRSYLAERAS